MRNLDTTAVLNFVNANTNGKGEIHVHDVTGRYAIWERIEDDRGFKDWPDRSTLTHELVIKDADKNVLIVEGENAGGLIERIAFDSGHGNYRILFLDETNPKKPKLCVHDGFLNKKLNDVRILKGL